MFLKNPLQPRLLIFSALCVLLLTLVFSCGEPPTGVKDNPGGGGGLTGSGDIDPGATGSFLLGTVSDSLFAAGYIEVWATNVMFDSAAGMVTFDISLTNFTEWPIEPAIHFVITSITPPNISVLGFDGETRDGFPFYDFSGKLGPDNVLDLGETTDPVTVKFHIVRPRSFSIGFRIDLMPIPQGAKIVGVVFHDVNKNGVRDRCLVCDPNQPNLCDRCEPGIPDITVSVPRYLSDGTYLTLIARTDQNGQYVFAGFDQGVYKVSVHPRVDQWEITSSNPLLVTLVQGPDGIVHDFYGANFGLYPLFQPGGETLFGPVLVGPRSMYGTLLDSTFVDTPSILPVIHSYYLEVTYPPFGGPALGIVDTASAWVNGVQVFSFSRPEPPDSIPGQFEAQDSTWFVPEVIKLPDGLVHYGENKIRLFTDGNDHAVLWFRVFKEP
jgi:hypothetical protein